MLRLVRSERERSMPPRRPVPTPPDATRPDATQADAAQDDDTADETEVREVRVRASRLADPVEIARYLIRHAERRRPRDLHEPRMLLRARIVAAKGEARRTRHERAQAVREIVRQSRPSMKKCLADRLARDPRIIVGEPASLVFQQASRIGGAVVEFDVQLQPGGANVPVAALDPATATCLETAIGTPRAELHATRVDVRFVGFVQAGHAEPGKLGSLNHRLSVQAVTLGWLHFERGAHAEALAYFEDARFVFHLAEYDYLVGLALTHLGRTREANEAFAAFLERRPHSPEAPAVAARLAL
jgi:hypothetical protein